MVRVSRVTALVALTSSMLLAYGVSCSSTSAGGGPDEGAPSGHDASSPSPGSDGGGGAHPNDAGSTEDATPAEASSPDNACAQLSSDQCGACCEDHHQKGADVFYNAFFGCLCGAQGKCQAQCATTDCSDQDDAGYPQPGDPCDQCEETNAPEDGGGACGPTIDSACGGNADCKALDDCWDRCP